MTRLALVGYGRIAPKHLEVFRALDCQIVAACNRSAAGREKARLEGGIPATYAGVEEMLQRERPDGVICCPSFDQLFPAALKVLPFGIPTLLEKPPGTSPAELDQLVQLAKQHGTLVQLALNRRRYSVLQRALDDAGGLDQVSAVFIEWSEDPQYLMKERGFSRDRVAQMIFANSLHGLDLLTFLAGQFINPAVAAINWGEPCRWSMAMQGISTRGVLGTFQSTWDSPARWRMSFTTPGKRYVFAPLESCQVLEQSNKDVRVIDPEEADRRFKPGFFSQAQAFLQMIRCHEVPLDFGLQSAAPAMALADALTRACLHAPLTEVGVNWNPAAR